MNVFYLRQSTASQARTIGPFIDDTDFKTPKTGLTINNTDVKLSINGGASVNKNSGGGTHLINGTYSFTFDATDTATVGDVCGTIVVGTALPVAFRATVVEEAVYDASVASGAAPLLATDIWAAATRTLTANPGLDAAGVRSAVGLASANLDTQVSTIDTVVDAIKVKTDQLTFNSGNVNANAEQINATDVLGTGTGGDQWRGA